MDKAPISQRDRADGEREGALMSPALASMVEKCADEGIGVTVRTRAAAEAPLGMQQDVRQHRRPAERSVRTDRSRAGSAVPRLAACRAASEWPHRSERSHRCPHQRTFWLGFTPRAPSARPSARPSAPSLRARRQRPRRSRRGGRRFVRRSASRRTRPASRRSSATSCWRRTTSSGAPACPTRSTRARTSAAHTRAG